jgi:predicted amino acid racemase
MFLDVLRRRNPALIEKAIALHQAGKIPANSYVIDLDTVEANARTIRAAADRLGLKVFAMTKQMGRSPSFCAAVARGGIGKAVAVDMEDARACRRAGLALGHIGHLVQIPKAEATAAASLAPDYWTVFNFEKAAEAAAASKALGRVQDLLARVQAEGDTFYRGHEGGFEASDVVTVADRLDGSSGARFAGITTFPALLFDVAQRKIAPTANLGTLARAAEALANAGRREIEINAPGTNSSVILQALADAGATQVEPGHGLTGTTPLHAVEDLPELPAVIYLSEVSHHHRGDAYCFGGGLYIDPVFPDYALKAIVGREPTIATTALRSVEIPVPAAIDYYGMIDTATGPAAIGDSVVFGFRPQAFVTRANVVGLSGVRGTPMVETISDAYGRPAGWPS